MTGYLAGSGVVPPFGCFSTASFEKAKAVI